MSINYQFIFDIYPDPVVLIDQDANIIASNNLINELFDVSDKPGRIESFLIDKKNLKEILHNLLRYHKVVIDKVIVKLTSGLTQTYEVKATIVSESNGFYLLVFNDLHVKSEIQQKYIEQLFATELNALNPYLNKTGKELVQRKIASNIAVTSISNELNSGLLTEKLNGTSLKAISNVYPQLSKRELTLAYYLGNDAKIQQLITITGKTSNSIRVMLHRIVTKAACKSTNEFIEKIKLILVS